MALRPASRLATALALCACAHTPHAYGAPVLATEFYDLASDRYFVTTNPLELGLLGSNGPFRYWYLTGTRYYVESEPAPGTVPVCRFFSTAFGRPTHFFTSDPAECESLRHDPRIIDEGVAFHAPVPGAAGRCAAGTTPVYRLYSGRYDGSPSHVYTPIEARAARFEAHGFVRERVEFCVPTSAGIAQARTAQLAGTTWRIPGPTGDPGDQQPGDATLAFAGPPSSQPIDTGAMTFAMTSAFPYFYYATRQSPSRYWPTIESAMGWNPLTQQYEGFEAAFGWYWDTGDTIGGRYVVDWKGGDTASSCHWNLDLNRGFLDDIRPDAHPLQPMILRNLYFVDCGPARVAATTD